ncbi:MAG: D-aminoacylase [Acidobacteria bacterium]|nr:D-aminoacylase [Acidobacteriota bacterium]
MRLSSLPVWALCAAAFAQDHDIVIRGARVVDGSGNPWFHADVAVKDGVISRVGRLASTGAARIVDAGSRILAPGFIDLHTHIDESIEEHPSALNFLRDGVTTAVTGNCGSSHLDLAAFFGRLSKSGAGINVASLIGHNSIRRDVMGSADRAPSADELARMRGLVATAMRDGSMGLSTGLEYTPGTYASTGEIIELASEAARAGGLYATHMRSEDAGLIAALEEAAHISEKSGARLHISHLKQDGKAFWGSAPRLLGMIEGFRARGLDVTLDQYPYDAWSTGLSLLLPNWALAGGSTELKKRLADATTRARLAREIVEHNRTRGNDDFSYVRIARMAALPEVEGMTLAAAGRRLGKADEAETILFLAGLGGASIIGRSMSEADVERIMAYPNTAVASDGRVAVPGQGSPHPRSYGTNARVLAEYTRKRGVLRLEDAIRRMTSLPARAFGLRDRGLIREGLAADLVLFDPASVADLATFERPYQYSKGFDYVMVNGRFAIDNGAPAGLHGRPLRRR